MSALFFVPLLTLLHQNHIKQSFEYSQIKASFLASKTSPGLTPPGPPRASWGQKGAGALPPTHDPGPTAGIIPYLPTYHPASQAGGIPSTSQAANISAP